MVQTQQIVYSKHVQFVYPLCLSKPVKNFSIGPTQTAAAAESLQSCLTLCDPVEGSLPGSSVHGIFHARVLEWGAIAFSGIYKYIYISHYGVQLKLTQHCKSIILQKLKK